MKDIIVMLWEDFGAYDNVLYFRSSALNIQGIEIIYLFQFIFVK